jgi:cation:H+ antiporter
MVMVYVLFVIGIYFLIKSADWIVDGSSSLAKRLGVSSLIVGLTVVAFGTSLPELVVNVFASFKGAAEVSFGNIVGSNISNILLILGITAIIGNIRVKSETVWKQIPFALLAAFVLFALVGKIFSGEGDLFTWRDGLILLALFATFLYYIFQMAMKDKKHIGFPEDSDETWSRIVFKIIVGLIGIYFGGKWVVEGAVFIAGQLGLSEFLISATIIAIGTSLPELVVCIVAVLKKNVDLVVGNIVGSNIFNVLWVFGIIPFIGAIKIPSFVIFDVAIMFFVTLLLFVFMFVGKKRFLGRKEGVIFVLLYVLYLAFLIIRG